MAVPAPSKRVIQMSYHTTAKSTLILFIMNYLTPLMIGSVPLTRLNPIRGVITYVSELSGVRSASEVFDMRFFEGDVQGCFSKNSLSAGDRAVPDQTAVQKRTCAARLERAEDLEEIIEYFFKILLQDRLEVSHTFKVGDQEVRYSLFQSKMSSNYLTPHAIDTKSGSDTLSEISENSQWDSREDLRDLVAKTGVQDASELHQDRFKVDRKKLEHMLLGKSHHALLKFTVYPQTQNVPLFRHFVLIPHCRTDN